MLGKKKTILTSMLQEGAYDNSILVIQSYI